MVMYRPPAYNSGKVPDEKLLFNKINSGLIMTISSTVTSISYMAHQFVWLSNITMNEHDTLGKVLLL